MIDGVDFNFPFRFLAVKQGAPSKVKISNVNFKNVKGTSASQVAVKLVCSKEFPCEHVQLSDINLKYSGQGGQATSTCANVNGVSTGIQVPPSCVQS
jgi:galacturan 1,4-alpha-galacturonidase